ncbi:GPN-loop GTPase [Quillaja saponaria]|uniref:GPN-loop GTPase n=1 Tax=Quillaja saponaria TaxID=32244 RepID=A0AAD7LBB7_QUISA|nr:GPN-loop GTPase [Quillaja saponaria]
MDVDGDLKNLKLEESASMQVDSDGSYGVQAKGKEKEELTETMEKLNIEGSSSSNFKRKPVIIIVVGMAGCGKTTFLHRLVAHTHSSNIRGYVMNLDPAVMTLPFGANIDIRDTVRYKEVMKQFNLGPNGGILTSLNLFATKFDEVISVIEKRADQLDYVLVDTPVDTPRAESPTTFMSNMLYACSILYKTHLPLVLAFNKTDVAQHQFALEWMEDYEAFLAATSSDHSYTSTLTQSLALSLDEFYKNLRSVGVSAVSGAGVEAFFKAIEASAEEYMENYKADLDKRRAEKQRLEDKEARSTSMMDEEDEEDEEEVDDDYEILTEDEDVIDEDEDEEVAKVFPLM